MLRLFWSFGMCQYMLADGVLYKYDNIKISTIMNEQNSYVKNFDPTRIFKICNST